MTSKHTKVLLEYENSSGQTEIESVWAVPVEHGYRIDNIPFYAHGLSFDDTVAAIPDTDGLLRFSGVISPSGHSTLRLWFKDAQRVAEVREALNSRGCASELSELPELIAVDVPPSVNYVAIRGFLDAGEGAGVFEYEEACLRHDETKRQPDQQ